MDLVNQNLLAQTVLAFHTIQYQSHVRNAHPPMVSPCSTTMVAMSRMIWFKSTMSVWKWDRNGNGNTHWQVHKIGIETHCQVHKMGMETHTLAGTQNGRT